MGNRVSLISCASLIRFGGLVACGLRRARKSNSQPVAQSRSYPLTEAGQFDILTIIG